MTKETAKLMKEYTADSQRERIMAIHDAVNNKSAEVNLSLQRIKMIARAKLDKAFERELK